MIRSDGTTNGRHVSGKVKEIIADIESKSMKATSRETSFRQIPTKQKSYRNSIKKNKAGFMNKMLNSMSSSSSDVLRKSHNTTINNTTSNATNNNDSSNSIIMPISQSPLRTRGTTIVENIMKSVHKRPPTPTADDTTTTPPSPPHALALRDHSQYVVYDNNPLANRKHGQYTLRKGHNSDPDFESIRDSIHNDNYNERSSIYTNDYIHDVTRDLSPESRTGRSDTSNTNSQASSPESLHRRAKRSPSLTERVGMRTHRSPSFLRFSTSGTAGTVIHTYTIHY